MKSEHIRTVAALALAALAWTGGKASAAQCGNTSAGFETWKQEFSAEAKERGVGSTAISALMATHYANATIGADRGQHSFHLSLDQFMHKRGGAAIASRGRGLKQSNAALFASIQARYGVPPGPLIAIWGMESGFGAAWQPEHVVVDATLSYDCRRSEFFTDQLYAALKLIDRGAFSASPRFDAWRSRPDPVHAQDRAGIWRRQPGNTSGALMSTANYLHAHGWTAGAGYQPGEPKFGAIQAWNAATVYQQAIAIIGKQIDGGQ